MRKDDTARIRGLFVLPEYQRKGIAAQLLARFEERARREGAVRILLLALTQADWAISFYKKQGFEEVAKDKDNTISRFWRPMPESTRVRHPDVPISLLEKSLT